VTMKGEWCYFESYFNKNQCEEIVKKMNQAVFETARIGAERQGTMNDIRRSRVAWISENDKNFSSLYQEIDRLARWANRDWFDFHLSVLPPLQYTEYDSAYQGKYGRHKDIFWLDQKNPRHRKLSIVVNLTDPNTYEGGDFVMYEVRESPSPQKIKKQGTVLVFPAIIDHEVTQVTKGIRNTIVGWYEGPKWK